jgi:membrane glycosyltransferase
VERFGKPTSRVVYTENSATATPIEKEADDTLEPTSLRLDGLEAYIMVLVLVSTASFTDVLGGDLWRRLASASTFLVSAMVTLLGMHSTIIFVSTILYGKPAVGMSRDDTLVYFREKMKDHRIHGLNALAACIIFFAVEVCLVVADQLPSAKLVPPFLALLRAASHISA